LWLIIATLFSVGTLFPAQALAQLPARFYLKTLSGANAVPLIVQSISAIRNPFDASHTVTPGAQFDATLAMAGYAKAFPLFDRAAMAALILPMGRISGDVTVAAGRSTSRPVDSATPMIEFDINVLGPRAQISIPDAILMSRDSLSTCLLIGFADRRIRQR